MSIHLKRHGCVVVVAVAGAFASVSTAMADVVVLKSDVAGIKTGATLNDESVLDIPAKKSVRVLIKPTNVTKLIPGPFKGTAASYVPSTISRAAAKPASSSGAFGSIGAPPPPPDGPKKK